MNKKTYLISLTCLLSLVGMVGCNEKVDTESPNNPDNRTYYDKHDLHYLSDDSGLDSFMNDFVHRNMRYDEYSVGVYDVAHGTNFAKNWESMAVTFQNAVGETYGEDKINKIYSDLNNIPQNDQGMIYNTDGKDPYDYVEGQNCPHGWPFPTWRDSTVNYKDRGSLKAVGTTAFEFNSLKEKQSLNWKADNGTFELTSKGYAKFSITDSDEPLRFYRDDLDNLLTSKGGIDTTVAPLIEYDLSFSSHNLDDFYVIFKTKDGGDTWKRAKQSLYSTVPVTSFANFNERAWLQMYLDNEWDQQIVTAIGFEFVPKEGKKLTISDGIVNYIRPSYDTRQSNGTYQWILALYNYYMYTQNIQKVSALMNKARKAITFLNHALEGEKGLLDISYFYGHNGISVTKNSSGNFVRDPSTGIGNGYWDLMAPSELNLEANVYYYQALKAMAKLEQAMLDSNTDAGNSVSVLNRIPGEDIVTYSHTPDSLNELANKIKTNIEKDIKVEQVSENRYQNTGGFWNPTTQRFAFGINEATGEIMDYGLVYFNEEAICAGIGTEAQQLAIMNWIDGSRNVSTDKSQGKDIYFYEFAPRFSTCDTTPAISGPSLTTFEWYVNNRNIAIDESWSRQLQNGGAAIAWSYYDIVARAKVLGSENAYKRLKEMQNWYEKVQNAKYDDGLYFYEGYYDELEQRAEGTDQQYYYTIQNSSITGAGPGTLGLNGEFIESVIFIRSLPDAFSNMDGSKYHTISFTNNLGGAKFIQSDNLRYINATYSLKTTEDSIELFDLKGEVAKDIKACFKFKNKANPTVLINGEATNDYRVEDGFIIVETLFTNIKVTVK